MMVCPGRDSNSHALRRHPLKMVCLPVPPPGRLRPGLSSKGPTRAQERSRPAHLPCGFDALLMQHEHGAAEREDVPRDRAAGRLRGLRRHHRRTDHAPRRTRCVPRVPPREHPRDIANRRRRAGTSPAWWDSVRPNEFRCSGPWASAFRSAGVQGPTPFPGGRLSQATLPEAVPVPAPGPVNEPAPGPAPGLLAAQLFRALPGAPACPPSPCTPPPPAARPSSR